MTTLSPKNYEHQKFKEKTLQSKEVSISIFSSQVIMCMPLPSFLTPSSKNLVLLQEVFSQSSTECKRTMEKGKLIFLWLLYIHLSGNFLSYLLSHSTKRIEISSEEDAMFGGKWIFKINSSWLCSRRSNCLFTFRSIFGSIAIKTRIRNF